MNLLGLTRLLTAAAPLQPGPPGKARLPRAAALLLGTALLVGCGGSAPSSPTGGSQPVSGRVTATVERLPASGDAPVGGTLRLSAVTPAAVRVTVDTAPAGVTVTPGAPTADGPDTLVPLTVTGRGSGAIGLTVTVSGQAARVTVALAEMQLRPLRGGAPYLAAAALSVPGALVLRAPANAEEALRHSLLRVPLAGGAPETVTFPLQGFEAITSHAARGDELWAAARGVTSAGSFLLRRGPGGQTQRFAAGTTDTLNNLTPTPDGRVWFTAYGQQALLSLDPASGQVRTLPVDGMPETLVAGADGTLYFTRRGAAPAVVGVDPATGRARTYPVGTANVSVPDALHAAPDGTLWFAETRTGAVQNLDPRTGTLRALNLPAGTRPSALAVTPAGTLWVADQSRGVLLRVPAGASSGAALGLPPATPAGPRALTVTPDGAVWFETGGQLVRVTDGS